MQFTFEDVKNQLVPASHRLMDEWVNRTLLDEQYTWQNGLFRTEPTNQLIHRFRSVPEIEMWDEWRENELAKRAEFPELDEVELELTEFSKYFDATDKYMKYGRNNAVDTASLYLNDLNYWTEQFVRGGLRRMPEMAAGVFLNAFSAAAQPMPDGTALIANAHTDVPGDNLTTTELSPQLFSEFDAMRVGVNAFGEPRMWNWDTIIIGPDNEAKLDQLINAQSMPGGMDNDANPWRTRFSRKIVLPWLDDQVQTGASDYVFVLDSRQHNLLGLVAEMPHFLEPFKQSARHWKFEATTIFSYFALNNAGIAGSTGADAAA